MEPLTSFFDKHVKPHVRDIPRAAWMNIAGGFCVGVVLGVPPMLIYFQTLLSNCLLATTSEQCGNVVPLVCKWEQTKGTCIGDTKICDPIWGQKQCDETLSGLCLFNSARNHCEQAHGWGWSNSEVGFFATSFVIGAAIASWICSLATTKAEQMKRLNQSGMIVCVGAFCAWGSWLFFTHSAILSGICFIVTGMGAGGFFALAPPVVSAAVPARIRTLCGTMFQLSLVFGIMTSSLIALILGSTYNAAPHVLFLFLASSGAVTFYVSDSIVSPVILGYSSSHHHHQQANNNNNLPSPPSSENIIGGMMNTPENSDISGISFDRDAAPPQRNSTLPKINSMDGIAIMSAANNGSALPNSNASTTATVDETARIAPPQTVEGPRSLVGGGSSENNSNKSETDPQAEYYRKKQEFIRTCTIVGALTATSLQLTGINAIMTAAPKITANIGIGNPLVGNFIIMFVNAVSCIPAIPLANRYPATLLFLIGLAGCSFFCLATALAMLIESPLLALFFVCCYLVAFESFQAPMFFTLITEMFPPGEARSTGAARVILANFLWNIVVNAMYPGLCDALMPVGDHSGGVRRVFIIFGFLGFICLGILHYTLPKTYLGHKSHETPPISELGGENNHEHQNGGSSGAGNDIIMSSPTSTSELTNLGHQQQGSTVDVPTQSNQN